MTHNVVTTERAAHEIEDAAAWWARERSVQQAERWYEGIRGAIAGLSENPASYPLAAEHELFAYEIRELHYGLRSKPTHCVIFTIVGETVLVLTVRHAARRPLGPEDLA